MGIIRNFLDYWYLRYLLTTDLYMLEQWERHVFHILCLIIFTVLYFFNTMVILKLVSYLARNFHETMEFAVSSITTVTSELYLPEDIRKEVFV